MPIFDYQCTACGHTFDALQKAGEGALRKCPECGKLTLKKLLAAPNFILKGTGWYQTDFRDGAGGKKAGAKADGQGDKKDQAKDGGGDSHGHSHGPGCGHTHSHGGHTHTHGPGDHKH
ncbi:MAG: zinc ribbon domain-containing protein [Gammaproteobacteria bacterium PRO9]|nr:zinc ribbon domain-containing protein [Gammaproteobacteria bacterium PRO9]